MATSRGAPRHLQSFAPSFPRRRSSPRACEIGSNRRPRRQQVHGFKLGGLEGPEWTRAFIVVHEVSHLAYKTHTGLEPGDLPKYNNNYHLSEPKSCGLPSSKPSNTPKRLRCLSCTAGGLRARKTTGGRAARRTS